jgi:hypothetical protein
MHAGAHIRTRFPSLATGVFEYAIAFETLGLDGASARQRMQQCLAAHAGHVDWDTLLTEAAPHADIRAGFRILPCSAIQFSKDRMRLDGIKFDVGSMVGTQICKATELAIFVASTGSRLESWVRSPHLQDNPEHASAAMCLCDFALQSALEWIERRITETAKSARLGTTNRFSPGFCTWAGADQSKLFSLLPQGFCGVLLGADGTMDPAHSVSGVIGFGPEAKRLTFHCQTCPVEDCYEPINA